MINPETRVQIRRYFYAEHWKIGTIAQALNVHPDTVRRAIEVEPACRAAAAVHCGPVSAVCAAGTGAASTLARYAHLSDDPGSWLLRQRRATAPYRGPLAPTTARSFPSIAGLSRRAGPGGLGLFRLRHGRPRQAPTLLLRHHLVLVAGLISGVLLRPDHGEFSARPRARFSGLVRRAPRHPV